MTWGTSAVWLMGGALLMVMAGCVLIIEALHVTSLRAAALEIGLTLAVCAVLAAGFFLVVGTIHYTTGQRRHQLAELTSQFARFEDDHRTMIARYDGWTDRAETSRKEMERTLAGLVKAEQRDARQLAELTAAAAAIGALLQEVAAAEIMTSPNGNRRGERSNSSFSGNRKPENLA